MSQQEKYSIVAIGSQEFTMGFRLTGIQTHQVSDDPNVDIKKIIDEGKYGIMVCESEMVNQLKEQVKEEAEKSIKPVLVSLSKNSEGGDNLRDMIIKSLGVDLYKD